MYYAHDEGVVSRKLLVASRCAGGTRDKVARCSSSGEILDAEDGKACRIPTCIARKAIRATRPTGMVGRASPFADNQSMRNGSAS